MKTLITHINPHLDDIGAIWLFRKFLPDFKDATLEFISASKKETGVDKDPDRIYLGVGRGQFDEHKGDLEDSAASLVGKYLKQNGYYPQDETKRTALEELIDWIRLEDLGRMPYDQYGDFSVPAFIRPNDNLAESSKKATELGEEILDRILQVLTCKHQALKDWEKKAVIQTGLGRLIAITSKFVTRAFCKSYHGEADLFLMVDPKENSVQYYSDQFDLEPIYKKVKSLDPAADWFLHQSHHMVICGGGSAPDSKRTKLSFKQLIEAVKSL